MTNKVGHSALPAQISKINKPPGPPGGGGGPPGPPGPAGPEPWQMEKSCVLQAYL